MPPESIRRSSGNYAKRYESKPNSSSGADRRKHIGGGLYLAQAPGIKRTDLLRNDISISGREVVQALVEIAPGVVAPNHSHPGEEVAYVVEGMLEYQLEGRPPVTLKAGEALFIPSGTIHSAKNVGTGTAVELATYIVEKGKPLLVVEE